MIGSFQGLIPYFKGWTESFPPVGVDICPGAGQRENDAQRFFPDLWLLPLCYFLSLRRRKIERSPEPGFLLKISYGNDQQLDDGFLLFSYAVIQLLDFSLYPLNAPV